MLLPTIIEFSNVSGRPRIRKDMPGPLRIGDRILLELRLSRTNGGRQEILDVRGEFKVGSIGFDATGRPKQILTVDAIGKDPTWRAIKKQPSVVRQLAPTHSPRTKVT